MDNLDKQVEVHVRSPSLNETLVVNTTLNATILNLKNSIQRIHPQHPSSNNQRIIYSGKLLEDTETLINVLKKVNDESAPIFHLVVKPSLQTIGKSQLAHSQAAQSSVQSQQPSSSFTASSNTVPLTFEPLHQQQQQQADQQQQQQHVPAYPPVLPGGYQVVMIQGQYYLAPVLVPSLPLPPLQGQQQTQFYQPQYHTQSMNQQQPDPQQLQREPIIQPFINQIPQQQQQQQARPAIAQRGTSIWLALKLIVVLFMVCQGASIERIFLFHAIAVVFFFYQTGRVRFVLRRVRAEDLNRPRPGQQPQQQQQAQATNNLPGANGNAEGVSTSVNNTSNNDNQSNGRGQTSGEGSSSSASNTSTNETPARPLTAMEVWKRGAYAFVASLWPTYGVDPRIAQAFENDNNQQRDGADEF